MGKILNLSKMTKEELRNGIENALNKGESLQKAMQSFVNAGYTIEDVKAAASEINMGVTGSMAQQPTQSKPTTQSIEKKPKTSFFKKIFHKKPVEATTPKQPIVQATATAKPKKKIPIKIIVISSILIILLIALGFILFRL